jgi:hypothetical protein
MATGITKSILTPPRWIAYFLTVPKDVETAIQNGRELQKLITEAGRRYTVALKNERRARS